MLIVAALIFALLKVSFGGPHFMYAIVAVRQVLSGFMFRPIIDVIFSPECCDTYNIAFVHFL